MMTETASQTKVQITMQALIQRINRKLAPEDERLRATRGERGRLDVGDYYVVSVSRNYITASNVDPEELGRELGVLRDWEEVPA